MALERLATPLTGILVGTLVFVAGHLLLGRPILPGPTRDWTAPKQAVLELDPQRLYAQNCAACHQADGRGVQGVFPPLAGSEWVVRDPETPIRIVILGLSGPIEVAGSTYNGVMPGLSNLTDAQVARVVSYIRTSFGNSATEVDEATVAAVRQSLQGRSTPWNGGAELETVRSGGT